MKKLDAEFNSIKNIIVVLYLWQDQQIQIVQAHNFLLFIRIQIFLMENILHLEDLQLKKVFETLDKIAAVPTGTNDRPIDPFEQVRIIKTTIVVVIKNCKIIDLSLNLNVQNLKIYSILLVIKFLKVKILILHLVHQKDGYYNNQIKNNCLVVTRCCSSWS